MRKISMAAVSAMALLTTSAYAQQSPSADTTPRSGTTPAYSPAGAAKAPAQNPLKQEDVSKIEGTSVLDSEGKKIADVSRGLMKPEGKKIDRLVVRAGGIVGVGGHFMAVPILQSDLPNSSIRNTEVRAATATAGNAHLPSFPVSFWDRLSGTLASGLITQ